MTNSELNSVPIGGFILGRDGARLSFAGALAIAFVVCLGVAALVASGIISGDVAFGCFVLVVVAISWWSAPATAVVVAVLGFLFANGFAFDSAGTLAWHGEADLLRLVALVALALIVSVLGYGRVERARHQASGSGFSKRVSS